MLKMELDLVRAWITHRMLQLRQEDSDRGNVSADVVIWTTVVVVLALAIGAIVVAKVTDKANSINLQ